MAVLMENAAHLCCRDTDTHCRVAAGHRVPFRRSRRLEGTPARAKIEVVSVAPLLAETLRRMHEGDSVVELLEP